MEKLDRKISTDIEQHMYNTIDTIRPYLRYTMLVNTQGHECLQLLRICSDEWNGIPV